MVNRTCPKCGFALNLEADSHCGRCGADLSAQPPSQVDSYIAQCRQSGMSDSQIRQKLFEAGWTQGNIDRVLPPVTSPAQQQQPAQPRPRQPAIPQPVQQPVQQKPAPAKKAPGMTLFTIIQLLCLVPGAWLGLGLTLSLTILVLPAETLSPLILGGLVILPVVLFLVLLVVSVKKGGWLSILSGLSIFGSGFAFVYVHQYIAIGVGIPGAYLMRHIISKKNESVESAKPASPASFPTARR